MTSLNKTETRYYTQPAASRHRYLPPGCHFPVHQVSTLRCEMYAQPK